MNDEDFPFKMATTNTLLLKTIVTLFILVVTNSLLLKMAIDIVSFLTQS